MHAHSNAVRKPQTAGPALVSDTDRAAVQRVARALERALDQLPTTSTWWHRLDELHEAIAYGLEPAAWLSDDELEQLGIPRACPAPGRSAA